MHNWKNQCKDKYKKQGEFLGSLRLNDYNFLYAGLHRDSLATSLIQGFHWRQLLDPAILVA